MKCSHCNYSISVRQETCPQCHKKWWEKKEEKKKESIFKGFEATNYLGKVALYCESGVDSLVRIITIDIVEDEEGGYLTAIVLGIAGMNYCRDGPEGDRKWSISIGDNFFHYTENKWSFGGHIDVELDFSLNNKQLLNYLLKKPEEFWHS